MLSETRRNSTEIYEIGTCRKSRTWAPCFRARIFSIRKYQTGTRRKIVIFHTCFTTPRLLIRISAIGQLTAQLHIPPCLTARLNLFQSIRALKIQRLRRMCLCARRSMQAGSLRVRLPRRLLRLILHRIHQVRLRQTRHLQPAATGFWILEKNAMIGVMTSMVTLDVLIRAPFCLVLLVL